MTYNGVFIETSLFTRLVSEFLNDEEYSELQSYLVKFPESGIIIQGSGGVRKLRWARAGMGRSGGLRVIYYWLKSKCQFFMLTLYSKSESENIDQKTLVKISKQIEAIT